MCPYHKRLEFGELHEYYDTRQIVFDCGTFADYGYGYYDPPKLYKSITIFKDDTGFTAWVPRAGYAMLARMVTLKRARLIAKKRLATGGIIKEAVK